MKEIKALIRSNRLEAVLEQLHGHPELPGVTISYVQGFGRTVGREPKPGVDLVPYDTASMIKIECIVADQLVDEVVQMILSQARTGVAGDGKIVIYPVEELIAIRNGDRPGHVV